MHSLYLTDLVEIANASRQALAINSRICAAFCILPVYNQLLAHASANVATNTTAMPCTIGAHDSPVFSGYHSQDLSTGASPSMPRLSWLVKLYENLTYVRMWPAVIALNYSIKDIRNDVRQIEKSQLNRLMWSLLTLAPITSSHYGLAVATDSAKC